MKIIGLILALLFSVSLSLGQSLSVFDVDTTNFPLMKAKIFVMDANGNQLSNLSPNDFTLKENGQFRTVLNVSCPIEKPVRQVSLAMSFDVSGSMGQLNSGPTSMNLAKSTAKSLINILSANSESAIQTCDYRNHILIDFTENKSRIVSAIESINVHGDNNYTEQLLNSNTGLLNISKTGKYKRIAILIGDPTGGSLGNSELQRCIDTCIKYEIVFYAILYSKLWSHPNGIKIHLNELAKITGGRLFEGITDYQAAREISYIIQQKVQIGEFCEIEWQSRDYCEKETRFIDVEFVHNKTVCQVFYKPAYSSISKLNIYPKEIHFQNIKVGVKRDTLITITAINTDYTISGISFTNPNFSIKPENFSLNSGQSQNIILSYLPKDEGYEYSDFQIENEKCGTHFIAIGGNKNTIPVKKTLKLTHPNGGEYKVIGSKTSITWEGIAETDTVTIEYSLDSGQTWKVISEFATGLEYEWNNIPFPESHQCLIKISQYSIFGNPDKDPKIEWIKNYGDISTDEAYSIIATSDSCYVFAGCTDEIINGKPKISGLDSWIVKINKDGEKNWSKTFGGMGWDIYNSIKETKDKGFIASGYKNSTDTIILGKREIDAIIIKVDSNGNVQWEKTIGGSRYDYSYSVVETSDSGFVFTGYTNSPDGEVKGYDNEFEDSWTVKFDKLGNEIWQHTFGKKKFYKGKSIVETFDKGLVIVGTSHSDYDSISGPEYNDNIFITKLNQDGEFQWLKSFGFKYFPERANSVIETNAGDLIISGMIVDSLTQKVMGLIIKLDAFGNLIWFKKIDVDNFNLTITSAMDLDNNDFIFVGDGGNWLGGANDIFICKTDEFGNLKWKKTFGGTNNEYAYSVTKSSENGFIVAGSTNSNVGDIIQTKGGRDAFIAKFYPDGITLQEDVSDSVFSIVIPSAESRDVDMGYCAIGYSKDSIVTEFIKNTGLYKIRIDSIYFSGDDVNAFRVVPDFSEYELEPDESQPTEFKFSPYKKGKHEAVINIITQSDTLVQNISGEGYQPQLDIVSGFINFGEVELGNYKQIQDSTLIKNISNMPMMIKNVLQNDFGNSQFEIVNGGGSFILQPNEERKISMKFLPRYGGRSTGQLEFEYEGVGSPAIAQLFGTGIGGVISISNDSAYAGENISVKLKMENVKVAGIADLASNFETTLRFQNTILAPENNSNVKIVKDSTYLTVKGKIGISQELVQIPLIAGLGSVEESTIDIMNFILTDDSGNKVDYDFEFESGTFKLLGICYEGGARLINPNNKVELLQISPNPNDGNLAIELNLIEEGSSTLSIYNSNGQLMYEQNISGSTGKIDLNIDTKEYGNGLYFVSLQTPTIRKVKQMVVFK